MMYISLTGKQVTENGNEAAISSSRPALTSEGAASFDVREREHCLTVQKGKKYWIVVKQETMDSKAKEDCDVTKLPSVKQVENMLGGIWMERYSLCEGHVCC